MHYHRIAGQFYNRPLLLLPSAAETISAFLRARMQAGPSAAGADHDAGESHQFFPAVQRPDGSVEAHSPRASRFYGEYPASEDGSGRPLPFRRTAEGVGIVTIVGELVNRGAWIGASSGLISYEGIKFQLAKAVADPKTRVILLDIESPGGEAVGAFETAAAVRDAAKEKPVVAVVNGMAASAGYALASGATRIVTIPTGLSGSIGVVMLHADFSKFLEQEGIAPTLIFAGAHKVDGNPYEPLPESVRADLQADVEGFYDLFVESVGAGRGKRLTADMARATEARVFTGEEAVRLGLADEVGTFEQVLADLHRAPTGRSLSSNARTSRMDETKGAPGAETSPGITQAQLDAAVATARTEAATAERERVKGILRSEAATGRADMADHLAFETPMTVEQAVGLLAKAPVAKAEPADRLAAAMTAAGNPKVGPDAGADAKGADPYERGRQIALRAKGKTAA